MSRWVAVLCLVATVMASDARAEFADYFSDETMRIDYYHTGDAESETVAVDRGYVYGTWAGSLANLIDTLNYGAYYHMIYDAASGDLIYSRGFDSYFKEYQTSGPAGDGVVKTFHESAVIPAPNGAIIFAMEKRHKDGSMQEIFRTTIDPRDVMIVRGRAADPEVVVVQSLDNGDPHTKADIAIIAEGYTSEDEEKFRADLARFTETFFAQEPCKSRKSSFNVYGVLKPSIESGIDEPRAGVFRESAVGATFNSMGSERYVLTENNRDLRDIARHAPYDAVYIMINHGRYGGGGIYNFYCTFTSDNQWSKYLMVHEFGHSFFGLADEYYTSSTAYADFYPAGYEPAEPNITAALDPDNIKWKHLMADDMPVPTPWEKADYDSMSLEWQTVRRQLNDQIAEMRRGGAPAEDVMLLQGRYDKLDRDTATMINKYLSASKYAGKVGVYEGAGYATEGIYRPMVDCIMFSKGTNQFCTVCAEAMQGILDWYSQ